MRTSSLLLPLVYVFLYLYYYPNSITRLFKIDEKVLSQVENQTTKTKQNRNETEQNCKETENAVRGPSTPQNQTCGMGIAELA